MMVKASAAIFIFCLTSSWSDIENRPPNWLDQMVYHYKKLFLAEVSKMPALQFNATIEKAPPGYVDSPDWDFDSAMRLITLIQASGNKPMQRVVHEVLKPTRRIYVAPGRNKFKLFPSLAKGHTDNFYYDIKSAEYWDSDEINVFNATDSSAIILVTNPVECRLPSARISVDLLKDIMMTRALAAREMPTTATVNVTRFAGGASGTTAPGVTDVTSSSSSTGWPNVPSSSNSTGGTDVTNSSSSTGKTSIPTLKHNLTSMGKTVLPSVLVVPLLTALIVEPL